MEEKMISAFDALQMDPLCANRIEQAMNEKKNAHLTVRSIPRTALAACLILVMMVIALHPTAARAVVEIMDAVKAVFAWKPEVSAPDSPAIPAAPSQSPVWLKEKNGHVYFLANLENRDITGLFSAELPFTYIYEKDGISHYIAIGGDYDPQLGLKSVGYGEWLRQTDKMEDGMAIGDFHAGWVSGSSSFQYLDSDGTVFPVWYSRAIVEMDIPWGYTEAKQQLEAYASTE